MDSCEQIKYRHSASGTDLAGKTTMIELNSVSFGNGDVTFIKEVEATPTTSETTGNVTVKNVGHPGVPAYFEVTFMLGCDWQDGPIQFSNFFHLKALVLGKSRESSYLAVEAEAARSLAPMLRMIADDVEGQVAVFDAKADKT
jgi:hypothetical protein